MTASFDFFFFSLKALSGLWYVLSPPRDWQCREINTSSPWGSQLMVVCVVISQFSFLSDGITLKQGLQPPGRGRLLVHDLLRTRSHSRR